MSEPELVRVAKDGVVVVPELERSSLVVTGSDAKSWLNRLVSCDLLRVDVARGAYGLLLTKQGKIQSDVDVLAGPSALYASLAPGTGEALFGVLDRHLVMEDAELELAGELAFLRLIGGGVAALLDTLRAHPAVRAAGELDWLGLGGAALAVERSEVEALVSTTLSLPGVKGVRPSQEEWRALRIARGFPEFGRDFGADDNPHEASLEKLAVSFNKGCYLGQEVVCMQDMRGRVKRRLVALELPAHATVEAGAEVTVGSGERVGELTSVARTGPLSYAFARVRAPFFEPGSELFVAGTGARRISE